MMHVGRPAVPRNSKQCVLSTFPAPHSSPPLSFYCEDDVCAGVVWMVACGCVCVSVGGGEVGGRARGYVSS